MKNYKKNLSTLFVFLLLGTWANFANANSCTGAGTDNASRILNAGGTQNCLTEPDVYKIKVYEVGLCVTKPEPASLATDLAACTAVTKVAVAGSMTIANGVNSVMPGTFVRPDNGTYAYGYVILAPEFRITATKFFDQTLTGKNGGDGGQICWTLAEAYRDSGNATDYDGNAVTKIRPGIDSTYVAQCGETAVPGETIAVQDAFGGLPIGVTDDDGETGVASTESTPVDGAFIIGHLTDSDLVLATESANVTRLVGVVTFATPAIITDDSSKFTTSFKVSQGSLLHASNNVIRAIGAGPFMINMAVE